MKTTRTTTERAIDEAQFTSTIENRTVTLPYSDEAEEILMCQCDDWSGAGTEMVFWGSTESDDPAIPGPREWRIELTAVRS